MKRACSFYLFPFGIFQHSSSMLFLVFYTIIFSLHTLCHLGAETLLSSFLAFVRECVSANGGICIWIQLGIAIRETNAGVGITASIISVNYRSPKTPELVVLLWHVPALQVLFILVSNRPDNGRSDIAAMKKFLFTTFCNPTFSGVHRYVKL
jgi:hypothetical protein